MRVILASTSPRRRELLALLNIAFELADPPYVERPSPNILPVDQVKMFAEGKAHSCRDRYRDSLIIGCDTLIALDADLLGKPKDRNDAVTMVQRMSGRQHLIHTGVAVLSTATQQIHSAVETVHVFFKPLTPADVQTYVTTAEGLGKAGAYAIQGRGADLIEGIKGDYTAAVGLPLRLLARLLADQGVVIPVDLDMLYDRKPYPNWDRFPSLRRPLNQLH
jgi:septum formation protein